MTQKSFLTQEQIKELKKKKFFFLAWRDLDDLEAGGSELYIHQILSHWADLGLDVTLRTSVASGRPNYIERDGYKVIRKAGRYMVFPRSILSGFLKLDPKKYVIVETWNGMPFFSPVWFRGSKLIIIHHVHAEMWQMVLPPVLAKAGNLIEEKIAPLFYQNLPIVTASYSSKEEIIQRLKLPEKNISVLTPGVDPAFKPRFKKADKPLVLGVGRLVPVKRFTLFLDVVLRVKKIIKDLEVVIVGDGYEREKLQELIHSCHAQSWIKLAGKVKIEELIRLYCRAWVYLTTSQREGWNLTISEAMACGTAVVATDIVGHIDNVINGETGYLANSSQELSERVIELIKNESLRKNFSAKALEVSKSRNWQVTADRMLLLLFDKLQKDHLI